jgi:four helix bundle protein
MNENPTNPKTERKIEALMFDHEKPDVYRLELKFIGWVTPLLEEVSQSATGKTSEVRDQLDRASLSALLNTAEGNGKRQRQVRAKFFDDARGSATECAACLDALVAKQVATEERVTEGKKLLLRVVSMLYGLIDRFDGSAAFHEEPVEYRSEKPETERKTDYCSKVSRTRTRTSRI